MVAFGGSGMAPTRVRALRCPDPPGSSCRPSTRPRTSRRGDRGAARPRRGRARGFRILIVDDGSPGRDRRDRRRPRRRARRRRGAAPHGPRGPRARLRGGFARALDAGAGYVFEMDSDLSHDPADLGAAARRGPRRRRRPRPRLALRARRRRERLGRVREAISRSGSWYSRRVLGLELRDLTGGFKCFRAEVLRTIDLPSVRSRGYAFQVELTYRAIVRGYRVVEVPIVFRDRALGTSKMSWQITLEAARLVPQLRAGRQAPRRWVRQDSRPGLVAPTSLSVNVSRLAFVEGMDMTRSTLRRWNAAPMSALLPWSLGALGVAVALLYAVWVVAHARRADPSGLLLPGLNSPGRRRRRRPRDPAQLARAAAARPGLRRRLHRRQLAAAPGRALHRRQALRPRARPARPRSPSSPPRRRSRS